MNDLTPLPYSRQVIRVDSIYFSQQFVIVSGAGCGKTTLGDKLASAFSAPMFRVSAGAFMRKRATDMGITIEELASRARLRPDEGHDQWCDGQIREHGRVNNRVIDCHLPVFTPYGFIILLVCGLRTRAERRAKAGEDVSAVQARLEQRDEDDRRRYAEIYPGSLWLETDYDIVINTERHDANRCFEIAISEHDEWSKINERRLIDGPVMPGITPVLV